MRTVKIVALLIMVGAIVGCANPSGPVTAPLTTDMKGPVCGSTYTQAATKVGKASAEGILIVGFGDASIGAAAKDGQITRIHRVENKTLNIFGIYSKYTTICYGE